MFIREIWEKFTSFIFWNFEIYFEMISKFQKSELGKFISNFPRKHVITSTYNNEITNYMLVSTTVAWNSFETYQAKTSEAKKTKTSMMQKLFWVLKVRV